VYSVKVTACFMEAPSVAKCLPAECFLRGQKWWKSLGPMLPIGRCEFVQCYGWEVVDLSAYSPNLTTSELHLFGPHKEQLVGKQFVTDTNMKRTVIFAVVF
jgi:hypothetical protein